jgi:magnesium transporter
VKCLEILGTEQSAAIIEKLPLQVISVLLRQVQKEFREEMLRIVSKEISIPLRRMLHYPSESAGALADPLVLTFFDDSTVKEALRSLQKHPEKAIYYLYTVNRQHMLVGVFNMRELMLARSDALVSSVVHRKVDCLSADLGFKAILDHPGWIQYHAMPVVDNKDTLIGVIRYKTIHHIKADREKVLPPHRALAASVALGELYKIGITGLIRSAAAQIEQHSKEK